MGRAERACQRKHRGRRAALTDILCNYQGFRQCRVILVFDAYKVRGGRGEVQQYGGICIVYTKEAETADMYIEKATYQLAGRHRVRVATSDGAEQLIILGHGALRMSARALKEEIELADKQIAEILSKSNRRLHQYTTARREIFTFFLQNRQILLTARRFADMLELLK